MDVENKWPYLPITPTYDQYVQRWVVMTEREGFHLKTRSVMKEFLEDAKWMVLNDKFKKRALFKIRVDLWRRLDNLPEDRAKRDGQAFNQSAVHCVRKTPQTHPAMLLREFVEGFLAV